MNKTTTEAKTTATTEAKKQTVEKIDRRAQIQSALAEEFEFTNHGTSGFYLKSKSANTILCYINATRKGYGMYVKEAILENTDNAEAKKSACDVSNGCNKNISDYTHTLTEEDFLAFIDTLVSSATAIRDAKKAEAEAKKQKKTAEAKTEKQSEKQTTEAKKTTAKKQAAKKSEK